MSGIPVVIATNGLGIPVRNVTGNAPAMTVAANGKGIPIVLSSRGTPFVVQGAGTPAPTFTVQPSITGTPTVGQPLSALTYNDGTVINGTISARSVLLAGVATPTTYVLVTGDIGSLVAYKNDATGAGGSASATSAGVAVVAAGLPTFAFEAESSAIIARMTAVGATPTAARQYHLNRTVKRLKDAGIWALASANASRSRLFALATESSGGAALVNWFAPGTGDAVLAGTPAYTANVGYSSTTAGACLRTGVTLSQISANNLHMALFAGSSVVSGGTPTDIGVIDSAGTGLAINPYTGASATVRVMGTGSLTMGLSSKHNGGNNCTFVDRQSSTVFDEGRCGQTINAGVASTTVAPLNGTLELTLIAINNNGTIGTGSGRLISGFLLCPGLTAAQRAEAHAAIQSYLDGVRYGEPMIYEPGYAPASVAQVDAIFLGTTGASIFGAYRAARRGATAIILGGERDRTVDSLGGVVANGLDWLDSYYYSTIGGVAQATFTWMNAQVGRAMSADQAHFSLTGRIFNFAMRRLLDPTRTGTLAGMNVPVYFAQKVTSVTYSAGTGLYTVVTGDGRTFTAKSFIDNTDSQESFDAIGVPYITGSEAAGTGVEANNGYPGPAKFVLPKNHAGTGVKLDPYVTPGVPASGLLKGVITPPVITTGAPDPTTQAICYRLPLTDEPTVSMPLPTTPPPNYDAGNYEALGRLFAADPTIVFTDIFKVDAVTGNASFINYYDFNTGTAFGLGALDRPGVGSAWVTAQSGTFADRELVLKDVENQIRGLFYWILNSGDSRIPAAFKSKAATYGLTTINNLNPGPNDSLYWGNFPYVRECKRLNNTGFKLTGLDFTMATGSTPRSTNTVAVAAYAADDHAHALVAYDDGSGAAIWQNGGYFDASTVANPKPVPLEAIIPDASFAAGAGFSSATGPSATRVATSVLRMEPTRWEIGEAQGEMAAIRASSGVAFSAISYATLRTNLLGGGDAVAPSLPQVN